MRVLFLCFLSIVLKAQISLVKGPYLQVGTSNSMIVRWETNVPSDSKVEYDTSASAMNYFAGSVALDTLHEVQLSGLLPYTKYYYTIGTKTLILQGDTDNYFVTSPLTGQQGKYRFWATGDCGNMSTNQTNCKNQYNLFNKNRVTNGWLTMGDNAYYYGTNNEFNAEFFGVYQSDIMKHAILWPSPGNHDYNNGGTTLPTVPYYDIYTMPTFGEAGGVPSGTEMYYSYNYGNVHFVSLDSYGTNTNKRMYDTTSAQAVWLKQDLASNHSEWTVVYFHHPPYTMGSHNSDTEVALDSIRTYFVRMLEHYKVDLVLCGHSHDYERSKLMRGHYGYEASFVASTHNVSSSTAIYDGTSNSCPYIKDTINKQFGTVYVVSGSSGQLGGMQTSFPHDAMYYSDATNGGSFVLDIEENRLDGNWLCADGVIRDHFTMFKNVNLVSSLYIDTTQSAYLNASWPGNYVWNTGDTTRMIVVSPTTSSAYWVSDKFNCVTDTFKVIVTPVGIKEASSTTSAFKIFPNPAQESFTIEMDLAEISIADFRIKSVLGHTLKTVNEQKFSSGNNRVLIDNVQLPEGVYVLEATINGVSHSEKLMISK